MWLAAISLIIFIFIYIMVIFVDDSINKSDIFFSGVVSGFLISVSIAMIIQDFSPSITPMDVYQGKTTLEYKVVDGVKVDSCVIRKKEE